MSGNHSQEVLYFLRCFFLAQEKNKWWGCWECSFQNCGHKNIAINDNGGQYTNLKSHLKANSCLGEQGLSNALEELKRGTTQTTINFQFSTLSTCDKELHGWISFIVHKNLAVSAVDDKMWRENFSFAKHNVSSKTIRQTIVSFVEIVEEKLPGCLADKFGLLMDGWTKWSVHCFSLLAVWTDTYNALQLALLSMAPMQGDGERAAGGGSRALSTNI